MPRRRKNTDAWSNGGDEPAPPNHNAKERDQIIIDACAEITSLEAERRTIGEQIREIKQIKIKGELNMKIGDFTAALRLYKLEGDDRDQFFDTLRETFDALGAGEQLDWLRPRPIAAQAQRQGRLS